jgi:aminoglycoside phosphotransferase (APT) family kinase protein
VGAPRYPRPFAGERARLDTTYGEFIGQAAKSGRASRGHHNQNYVLPLTEPMARLLKRSVGTSVTVRIRRTEALPVVIRTWQNEAEILDAIKEVLPHVPECLVRWDHVAIHSYVEGAPLSSICGNGKPVDTLLIREVADLFAQMAQVRRGVLPPLPPLWPRNHTDSQAFLHTLVHLADQQIRKPNGAVFGGLFAALGIPEDALLRLAERVPVMARRPYSLLHADLHRDNLIVYGRVSPLTCVDWELATYGDPLHDLATHLVRMQYPSHQWGEVIDAWAEAMQETRPAAVSGLARDLRHYLAFERAQSVYPDVMRAARSLEESSTSARLEAATTEVRRALEEAAEPLQLRNVPGEGEIERTLYRWLASRSDQVRGGRGRIAKVVWQADRRLAERPDFPVHAVREALVAEGAAAAGRVFKGTAHLNTVVWSSSIDAPVVVRRKLPDVCRRETGFLSEHAVLRAIEKAKVAVAAPKVLALGESYLNDPFAIHTYVGPRDIDDQPPSHPVHGLMPHEADGLVDQLCALTRVDYKQLDPASGKGAFNDWLKGQLVQLVGDLPKESRQLARLLGLPDASRLEQILVRYEVSHRQPALLHGDLNPWNLVRRDDNLAVTIIDWEMALVGDPLYDLVRHMHLTPTRKEVRDRMFRRWELALPDWYTCNWRTDWRVYRTLEIVRSAYVDLDRIVTGASLDAPNVKRAVDSYAVTLAVATGALGLPVRSTVKPHLARALA